MDEVKIIKYSAENHSAVRRLFSSGMLEHRKAAVFFGLKSRKLQALLSSVFLLGYLCHSTWLGMGLILGVIVIQIYMVCWCYQTYVRYVHFSKVNCKIKYYKKYPSFKQKCFRYRHER